MGLVSFDQSGGGGGLGFWQAARAWPAFQLVLSAALMDFKRSPLAVWPALVAPRLLQCPCRNECLCLLAPMVRSKLIGETPLKAACAKRIE